MKAIPRFARDDAPVPLRSVVEQLTAALTVLQR